MWEKTVRDLAQERGVVAPKSDLDPKMRLDEMFRLATDCGLPGKLMTPPKEAVKGSEKKEAMLGRLKFHALVTGSMAGVSTPVNMYEQNRDNLPLIWV